ncbi:MAG: transcriptional repressor [Halieaceae bacterium]|nr:transcriptional repressor [Halieaceae bacterium]MCP5203347.1 transcriptional repressor [Pseudomonadales bacterium]
MNTTTNIDSVLSEAEQRCRDQGARLTEKRRQILSGLLHSDTALSAYEIADICRAEYGYSIPAMSVYRILDFLEGQRLVHKLNLANKYVACAHITCAHDHGVPQFLICGNCQRVKEISVSKSTIKALERSVAEAGYQLVSPQLEMNCLCETCRDD